MRFATDLLAGTEFLIVLYVYCTAFSEYWVILYCSGPATMTAECMLCLEIMLMNLGRVKPETSPHVINLFIKSEKCVKEGLSKVEGV